MSCPLLELVRAGLASFWSFRFPMDTLLDLDKASRLLFPRALPHIHVCALDNLGLRLPTS